MAITHILILILILIVSLFNELFLYGLVSTFAFVVLLPFYYLVRVFNGKFLFGWREKLGFFKMKSKYVVLACHYPFINAPGFYFLKMYQSTSYAIAVDTKTDLFPGMYINTMEPILSFRTINHNGKRLLLIAGNGHKTGENIELGNRYELLENNLSNIENIQVERKCENVFEIDNVSEIDLIIL